MGTRSLPVVARAVHSRVRAAVVQAELLGPSRYVMWALLIVLATAPIRCCVAAQMGRSICPITLATPLGVRNHEEFIRVPPPPRDICYGERKGRYMQILTGALFSRNRDLNRMQLLRLPFCRIGFSFWEKLEREF